MTTLTTTNLGPNHVPPEATPGVKLGRLRPALWGLWLIALGLGVWGVYLRFTQGHLPAGYGSYVPWGLWVALYFHGVGIAGGVFVLGAGGYLLDLPGFRSKLALRAAIVLSFAAILPSFLGVWFDLGHMERASAIFTRPRFTSMMAFNAWMYLAYMLVAGLCFLLSFRKQSLWLKPLLCLALLFSVLFPSQSGAFFGVIDAKPYWHSALLPMLFLASAVTAGAAVLLLVRAWLGPIGPQAQLEYDAAVRTLRWVTIAGVAVYFVFEFAEFSIALWSPYNHTVALDLVLWGPYWWVFWFIHLLLGGVVALALLGSRSPRLWLVGALLVAVCFLSARLNVLVPGQAVGEIQGLQDAFWHPRLRYIYDATVMEYLVGLFLLAVGMAAFYLGWHVTRALSVRGETGESL